MSYQNGFTRILLVVFSIVTLPQTLTADSAAEVRQILIVVGPSSHPPGTHEVVAGGRLIAHCLEKIEVGASVKAHVVADWPNDDELLDSVSSVVMIGDTFPPQRLEKTATILEQLGAMMDRGCGIACIHYATGLLGEDVGEDGDHPLLRWAGGYFANRTCPHHESIAKIFPEATITPAAPEHPVNRGWKPFTVHDEPYINNYFGGPDNQPGARVTVLATSMLPPESPRPEPVAWCVQRPDGGRGFSVVMPHFFRNWQVDDLRRLILNGIVWTAKVEVPAEGVQSELPELTVFEPASVHPAPRR